MAGGGIGERLEPFTKILPKPLIPIHGKSIIEHIIDKFKNFENSSILITINYKGKILKAYFDELDLDFKMSFVEETSPLGTAGSLSLINRKFSKPIFITNCDILIKTDYKRLYDFHLSEGFDITLVASAKEFIVPYGACQLNKNGTLKSIMEKPEFNFLINTGLYI